MDETQYRMGNYIYRFIQDEGFFIEKVGINELSEIIGYEKYEEPDDFYLTRIDLDEEWLLKLGFEKHSSINGFRKKTENSSLHFVIIHYENLWRFGFETIQSHCFSNFKYVHQLQNLYFTLTGKELKSVV